MKLRMLATGSASVILVFAVATSALLALSPGCSSDDGSALPDAGSDVLEGLTSLSISPPSAALEFEFGQTGTQAFTATGTFADGSRRDVTTAVGWTTTVLAAEVENGTFTATVPGAGEVTAEGRGLTASATITVKVNGEVSLSGTPAGASSALAGSPSAAVEPTVAYPLDGALFPFNLGDTEVHVEQGDPSQSIARIDVTGDLIDLHILGPCSPIAGAADGCAVLLEDSLVPTLAGASEASIMAIRVRLAASDGSALGESDALDVRWTFTEVRGGLYYWSARHAADTHIYRYDLDVKGTPPEDFFSYQRSPPLHDGTQQPCVGCHAVSLDGTKIGLTFGGSDPSDFALVDVATLQPIAVRNTDPAGFATFSALTPDAEHIVTALRGTLTLRTADDSLSALGEVQSPETAGEALTQPFWSTDARHLIYVGWVPGENGASDSFNGDVARGGQIFVTEFDGTQQQSTRVLVGRVDGRTSYYPAISDDTEWVVFNQSRCDGPPGYHQYGNDPCDGYDDASAQVFVVPLAGGEPKLLARLNGDDTWTNSWPRWSPTHGTFRGKGIYYIAFSSKRPYGLRLEGSAIGATPPQLWLAAVALEPGTPPGLEDPSFAPVWLPLQNEDMTDPTGNHVPQWAARALPIPK